MYEIVKVNLKSGIYSEIKKICSKIRCSQQGISMSIFRLCYQGYGTVCEWRR